MRTARAATVAFLAALLMQGCGDDKSNIVNPTPTPTVAAVQVSPSTLELEEGESHQLTATPVSQDGQTLDVEVTWSSADESLATVDSDGLVTAVLEGSVEILAEAEGASGTVTGRAALSVLPAGEVVPVTGGTVTYLNGAVVLEIPNGALTEATKITIRPSVSDVADEQPDMVGGTAYHFRPEGLQFQIEAQLTMSYETGDVPDDVKQERLSLYHRTETGWAEIEDSQVDTAAHAVSGPITSFSHYGVQESSQPAVAMVTVSGTASEPLPIGGTVQLSATLTDASGNVLDGPRYEVSWLSNDETIATVDQTGLVTAVARGRATMVATSEEVSGSAEVSVSGSSGEDTETAGNNMSWPVVFADGIGVTGLAVAEDPGVRPTVTEGITVDALPFFYEGNTPDYGNYYLQGGANTWRAEYIDGSGQQPYDASAYWGDNLTAREWKAGGKIRVEVALSATGVGTLLGYNMPLVLNPSSAQEQQGTDGTTTALMPLIFSVGPTLIVEQLDGQGGTAIGEVANTVLASEMNVAGRIVYGYQLVAPVEGWYRLRFVLASGSNVQLKAVGNAGDLMFVPTVVSARESDLEIHVTAG